MRKALLVAFAATLIGCAEDPTTAPVAGNTPSPAAPAVEAAAADSPEVTEEPVASSEVALVKYHCPAMH